MRLLKPIEGQSRQQVENASQELRSIQLYEVIQSKRKEIDDLDKSLVASLSVMEDQRKKEQDDFKNKILSLTKEVDELEKRKIQALIPLEEYEKELHTRDVALSKREEKVTQGEADIEDTKELLENRLDEVSDKFTDADKRTAELNIRELNIKAQEKDIKVRTSNLAKVFQGHYEDIEKKSSELEVQRSKLEGKETVIAEAQRRVDEKELELSLRERALTDKYQTFIRAVEEAERKYKLNYQK